MFCEGLSSQTIDCVSGIKQRRKCFKEYRDTSDKYLELVRRLSFESEKIDGPVLDEMDGLASEYTISELEIVVAMSLQKANREFCVG